MPGPVRVLLTRIHRFPEPWKLLLLGALAAATGLVSGLWPPWSAACWAGLVGALAVVFWADVVCAPALQPVSYDTLRISGDTIAYTALGETTVIRLADVSMLEFVREEAVFPDLYGPYIESKWWVRRGEAPAFEIMDEAPHREQLLEVFKACLPGFDEAAAGAGLQASGEGRWLCYHAARPDGGEPQRIA